MIFEALMTVPQVLAVTPQALAEVPPHVVQTAYENPGTTGIIGGVLYGALNAWEKYRPRLAVQLAGLQAAWQLSPTAAKVHAMRARMAGREIVPRRVSWQEDVWLKRLPPQLGPLIMSVGILHALLESWEVSQTLPTENVYHTPDFQLPYGMATMTAGFLTLVLGIETYARKLEGQMEQHEGSTTSTTTVAELQKQVARIRRVQKIAAYLCILDDIFPIMVFMRAML